MTWWQRAVARYGRHFEQDLAKLAVALQESVRPQLDYYFRQLVDPELPYLPIPVWTRVPWGIRGVAKKAVNDLLLEHYYQIRWSRFSMSGRVLHAHLNQIIVVR